MMILLYFWISPLVIRSLTRVVDSAMLSAFRRQNLKPTWSMRNEQVTSVSFF